MKKKRIYLKPQTSVMNIQTEGVIAASGDSGEVDWNTFCDSGCMDGSGDCGCPGYESIQNCNKIDKNDLSRLYSTTNHCIPNKQRIHFKLLPTGEISYWPCDKLGI